MKTTALFLAMFLAFAFTACEKEEPTPQDLNQIIGVWKTIDDVNINGDVYSHELVIHSLYMGQIYEYKNGFFNSLNAFYLTVTPDSVYLSYYSTPSPLLPEPGWNNYLQWDNYLLIGYNEWIRK